MVRKSTTQHYYYVLQWEMTVIVFLLGILFAGDVVHASTSDTDLYFVSVDGEDDLDTNRGSEGKPYRTLEYALNRVKPGGAIILRGGVYHEEIRRKNLSDISIISYPGERVIFDGTVA